MQNRNGNSLRDAVVLLVIVFVCVLGLHLYVRRMVNEKTEKMGCLSNLKRIGSAMMTYGLDYDDEYPVIGGADAPWSKKLGWDYDYSGANYLRGGAENKSPRSITASWYMLIREAHVLPVSFVCPRSSQKEFKYKSEYGLTELWDFGPEPYKHVSYAMQNPFGKFPARGDGNPSNVIAADMSPWFKDGDVVEPASGKAVPQLIDPDDPITYKFGNSLNHGGEEQNVLFGDGHVEFVRSSNVGYENDNIFTFWSSEKDPTDDDKQIGKKPTARDKDNDSKHEEDSFLAI